MLYDVIARSNRDEAIQVARTVHRAAALDRHAAKRRLAMTTEKQPAVYLMASARNGTLYVGVTSNLVQRASQHRTGVLPGFATRYRCTVLVWYELHADMTAAITREKQIKAGSRTRKMALIEAANPMWRDLYETIL